MPCSAAMRHMSSKGILGAKLVRMQPCLMRFLRLTGVGDAAGACAVAIPVAVTPAPKAVTKSRRFIVITIPSAALYSLHDSDCRPAGPVVCFARPGLHSGAHHRPRHTCDSPG